VSDVATLEVFLRGRVATTGSVSAAFAANACGAWTRGDLARFPTLDAELDARLPSPALRAASRKLGRLLLRAVRIVLPHARFDDLGAGPHQPVVLGAARAAFGLGTRSAALAAVHDAVHDAVAGPATAAVRLLGLDPFATTPRSPG
jgi:urease accessory protein